ncbi:MAG: respiratory nitrate reductase subunit gamma [Microthrixaceae bacterium]|nr:respiratory nitrate reductase subunit gamma [Microthrixaceae bacterium]
MTATETASEEASETEVPGPARLQPYQIAITIGVVVALIVVGSGIFASIMQWHDESPITREVFENIPAWLKVAFYTVLPVVIVYGAFMFAQRMKNWVRGGPDRRDLTPANAKRRLENLRAGLYMQTLLRDPAAGAMHSMIYFGFLILLAVTTVLEINHQLPEGAKFLHGTLYQAYSFVGDAAGVVFSAGVIWAIVRRYGQKVYRIRIKTKPEHALILAVLLTLGITGLLTEGARIAYDGMPDFEKWSFVGYPLGVLFEELPESGLSATHQVLWIIHVGSFVVFLAILPITMLRHIFTSPLNMYLSAKDRPKGAMKAMPNLMETGARVLRRRCDRGLHLEATARPRRLHDVRALHRRVSGARHRKATGSPGDRAQGR